MNKMDEIVNEIYDPEIEKPERQIFMRSCIKAWLHDAINKGVAIGKNDLALDIDTTIKKAMFPGSAVCIMGRHAEEQ